MNRHRKFDRALVRREIKNMARDGRQRIIDLGGSCDPVDRMVQGIMYRLDRQQSERDHG